MEGEPTQHANRPAMNARKSTPGMALALPAEEIACRLVLADQCARYPLMGVADLYKLAHQAAMGSEHAVTDVDAARALLIGEVAIMGAAPPVPVVEPISADGRIVRVNLRPYVAGGYDVDALLAAFLETGRTYEGSPGALTRAGAVVARWVRECPGPAGSPTAWRGYFRTKRVAGFPPGHHSDRYRSAYRPAYRVVLRALLPALNVEG
jgi:hypothetical protein